MTTTNQQIAERLKNYLKDKGYTNKEFAEKLGVSQSTIANYLNNVSDIQKIFVSLHLLAGINLEWLISGEGNPETTQRKLYLQFEETIIDFRESIEEIYDNHFAEFMAAEMPIFNTPDEFNMERYYKAQVEIEFCRLLKSFKYEFINELLDLTIPPPAP